MSRSSEKSNKQGVFKVLGQSVLFRRMVLMWSVLSTVLLAAIATALVILFNRIYLSTESSLLGNKASLIADVRELCLDGRLSEEESLAMLRRISREDGFDVYIFGSDLSVSRLDGSSLYPLEDAEGAGSALLPYAQTLFETGSLEPVSLKLNGSLVLLVGAKAELEGAAAEAVLCVRDVSSLDRRQLILSAIFLIGIVSIVFLGLVFIIRLTKNYVMPYSEITEAAIEMSHGNLEARVQREDEKGEIGLLARSFNRLGASLSQNFIQLESERSRLVQIVNSSSNGIAVTDASGELIQYNPALLELFSQLRLDSRTEINDDRRLMVIPDGEVWAHFDEVNSTGVGQRVVYPVDKERVLWINITPVVSAEGDQVGAVGNFQDMTELERLERTRREYVANVSHELRRPLTALQGLLEPIRDGLVKDDADKQRYYDIMLHEIERLSRLISDMMQLSRLQSDDIKMNIEPLDISDLVLDIADSYRIDVEGRGTRLLTEAPSGMIAAADADRVEQVLVILIDNALKFTPANGRIKLAVYRGGKDGILIDVEDNGCGISQEDLPHIFERFYKADKSHASEGTGLGLSIAYNILQKMDGSITCRSKLGEGTVMTVRLPEYKAERNEQNAEPALKEL